MVCFRYIIVNTLHKGENNYNDYYDDDNSNNNNNKSVNTEIQRSADGSKGARVV
jgi:hypothetical protein